MGSETMMAYIPYTRPGERPFDSWRERRIGGVDIRELSRDRRRMANYSVVLGDSLSRPVGRRRHLRSPDGVYYIIYNRIKFEGIS